MGTSQPIRSRDKLKELKDFYCYTEPNLRNYALICLGINTALRISDLLSLKWKNVYDFDRQHFRQHIVITEQKTKKETQIAINKNAMQALEIYRQSKDLINGEMYIFSAKKDGTSMLSRSQAFRIIKHASNALHFEEHISCHSMRKTFGYHAWKCGTPPAMLMEIYNHSSYNITKRYLGIEQEDKDNVFLTINL